MKKTQTQESLKDPNIDYEDFQRHSYLCSEAELRKKAKHSKSTFNKVQEEATFVDLASSTSYHNYNQIINSPKLNVATEADAVTKKIANTIEGIDVQMQADFQDFLANDDESDEYSSHMIN